MLPQAYRLPRPDVSVVLRGGNVIRTEMFDIRFNVSSGVSRFAFIVSKKTDKRATHRNRMKRLLGEALRRLVPEFNKHIDGVILIRKTLPDSVALISPLLTHALRNLYG